MARFRRRSTVRVGAVIVEKSDADRRLEMLSPFTGLATLLTRLWLDEGVRRLFAAPCITIHGFIKLAVRLSIVQYPSVTIPRSGTWRYATRCHAAREGLSKTHPTRMEGGDHLGTELPRMRKRSHR